MPPGTVIASAETLHPQMRSVMGRVYGCGVYNHYGSREMHNIAMECPRARGFHISAFTHVVEVVDQAGRSCPPGTEGELILTGLANLAMPLIRYRIGDRGTLGAEPCSCGRGLPLLASLTGRRLECFHTKEGGFVPGEYFVHIVGSELGSAGPVRYQIVQRAIDHVVFRVAAAGCHGISQDLRRKLCDATRLVMGADCAVEFESVREIPPAASGKYLYTVCEFDATHRHERAE